MKRKKAEGARLLNVDTVFVPICQGSHWTIGVVRPYAKTIEYFNPDPVLRKEQKVRQNKKSPNYLPNMSGKRLPAAAINATVAIAAVIRVKWDDEKGVKIFQALKSFNVPT